MKKIFLFSLFTMMLADCSGQKSPQDYVPQRSDYSLRSDVRVVNDDGEVVEIVRYKWKDGKLVEYEREQMSASDLADD